MTQGGHVLVEQWRLTRGRSWRERGTVMTSRKNRILLNILELHHKRAKAKLSAEIAGNFPPSTLVECMVTIGPLTGS